jgi:acyl-CoA synthetase (AMP-forming)/AMP-acid ligase II
MIIVGGRNVYSAEVATALASTPAVAACAAIAVPDDTSGERKKPGSWPSPRSRLPLGVCPQDTAARRRALPRACRGPAPAHGTCSAHGGSDRRGLVVASSYRHARGTCGRRTPRARPLLGLDTLRTGQQVYGVTTQPIGAHATMPRPGSAAKSPARGPATGAHRFQLFRHRTTSSPRSARWP